MNSNNGNYDLIIAGAGVSGLFTAWRLLQQNSSMNILILETLDRVGGRLQTTTVEIDGVSVKDEEGGMRFNAGMPYINQLITDLTPSNPSDLTPVPFLMDFGTPTTNNAYFRGNRFTTADEPAVWKTIYNLAPSEQDKSPGTIITEVMNEIMNQNGNPFGGTNANPVTPSTHQEWEYFRNVCKYNGTVINQWGFWAILRTYGLTEECVDFLEQTIGFMGPTQAYINAGESLQIILDFPNSPVFNTLQGGFQSIPLTLASIVEGYAGASIQLNATVMSVSGEVNNFTVDAYVDGVPVSLQSSAVVLALPKSALKGIIANSPILQDNPPFTNAVASVKNMELTKVGLYFSERWWHADSSVNVTCGPNFTDMPLGSVYSFQQFPLDPEADAAYNGPAALTIYTDYDRGNFWKEMNNIGGAYVGSIPQPDNTDPASIALVNEAMKQIQALFGLSTPPPMPVLSTFRIWGNDKYGYGYHQYRIGVNDTTEVYPNIFNPQNGLFVCNESWSPEQGWVEGALIASDYVLVNGFGLPPFIPSYVQQTQTETA